MSQSKSPTLLERESRNSQEEKRLSLTPRLSPLLKDFLSEKDLLFTLTRALGSPLNMLFPESLPENINSFSKIFAEFGLQGKIFFAHKCNQAESIIKQLALSQAGIDVSSPDELKHGLACGLSADRMEATGPKSPEFLALILQHGLVCNLDSIQELELLLRLQPIYAGKRRSKVLLRLSGFEADHSRFLNRDSRFGIATKDLGIAFDILESAGEKLDFLGFSFHLDTVSILERCIAVENCVELFEEAFARGLEPRVLNIGGGFKVNYLENAEDWHNYTSALKEAVLGTRPSLSWHGNSFGLSTEKGKLKGNFNSYNYFDEQSGPSFLKELLSQNLPGLGNSSTASFLRDNMIELWIEPGRALMDQCGITLARVNTVRRSSRGEIIAALQMKRQDISFLDQEIFIDPILIPQNKKQTDKRQNQTLSNLQKQEEQGPKAGDLPQSEAFPVYFAGNLCLESDMIYRHLTFLDQLPEPGDLLAFVNTAGYFMDFSASRSIMQALARKVAIVRARGEFHWFLDEEYMAHWNAIN